jgi:hypothetical protein
MELLMYTAARQSDALIYLDCDFTYPTAMITTLRRLLEDEGVDMVNCARTRTRPEAMPVPNYLANRSFAALAAGLHGIPTVDVHSGMRAYRSSVIRAFDFDGEGDALPIDTLLFPQNVATTWWSCPSTTPSAWAPPSCARWRAQSGPSCGWAERSAWGTARPGASS